VPAVKKQGKRAKQAELDLFAAKYDEAGQAYTLTVVNEIRSYVSA
jgi:hypothetical protein